MGRRLRAMRCRRRVPRRCARAGPRSPTTPGSKPRRTRSATAGRPYAHSRTGLKAMRRAPDPAAASRRDVPQVKQRTAVLSVTSNSALILLKVIAGTITGSVALLTEAVHSSIDLVASIVAFFSVRKAGEPADESHRYGHERFENLAAAIEGILILVGSAVIAFEAIRRLLGHGHLDKLGFGIAVVAFSVVVNVVVSAVLARNARAPYS